MKNSRNLMRFFFKKLNMYPFLNWFKTQIYLRYCYSDIGLIKKNFKNSLDREVNLINPIAFNDKLQWLLLNWYDPLAVRCADKYEVRKYVKKRIGSHVLNEIYKIYDGVDDICLSELPSSFVLKTTHGSGWNIICKNKNLLDFNYEFKKLKWWLKSNYYWLGREWVYKDIKPKILCEKYLSDESGKPPKDYKIFCFNGEPKLIQVDINRFSFHKRNFYDTNWNLLDVRMIYPIYLQSNITKPVNLDIMLKYANLLASDFPFVRIDFYTISGKIVFGEITFFPEAGTGKIEPVSFEYKMGKWLKLPINENH